MTNPLIHKLEALVQLTAADRSALELALGRPSYVRAGENILDEGADPHHGVVLLDGIACRYKDMSDGRRQLLAILLPGDIVDLHGFVLKRLDHAVAALSPCRLALVQRDVVDTLLSHHPRIALAFWRDTMVDAAILREWMVGIGQRTSRERMAHFFCEMSCRLGARGLSTSQGFVLPLTQQQLGDALGLSVIHINRTLKSLREEGLMTFRNGRATILDGPRLEAVGGFKPAYLGVPDALEPRPLVRLAAG